MGHYRPRGQGGRQYCTLSDSQCIRYVQCITKHGSSAHSLLAFRQSNLLDRWSMFVLIVLLILLGFFPQLLLFAHYISPIYSSGCDQLVISFLFQKFQHQFFGIRRASHRLLFDILMYYRPRKFFDEIDAQPMLLRNPVRGATSV